MARIRADPNNFCFGLTKSPGPILYYAQTSNLRGKRFLIFLLTKRGNKLKSQLLLALTLPSPPGEGIAVRPLSHSAGAQAQIPLLEYPTGTETPVVARPARLSPPKSHPVPMGECSHHLRSVSPSGIVGSRDWQTQARRKLVAQC